MLVNKAYSFRIYPNKEQQTLIAKTIGCSRFVFNHFLAMWNDTYESTDKGLSYNACSAMLPKMKCDEATAWLKEVDSIAIQSSLKNLKDAFDRFFRKQNKAPKFKSKNNPVQSYTMPRQVVCQRCPQRTVLVGHPLNTNGNIAIIGQRIKLPKLGLVRFTKLLEAKTKGRKTV